MQLVLENHSKRCDNPNVVISEGDETEDVILAASDIATTQSLGDELMHTMRTVSGREEIDTQLG